MLPEHMHICCDGALADTRDPDWTRHMLRENYQRTHGAIESMADLKATLRAGPYAWPGGYPLFFVTRDGADLSFDTVRAELANVAFDLFHGCDTGWHVVACCVNWEDPDLYDDHSGKRIPSAYAEPEPELFPTTQRPW